MRTQPERSESIPWGRDVEAEHEGGPVRDKWSPQVSPFMLLWATDFADGSDTSVPFPVFVAVDSLKPGVSSQSLRLEGWRGGGRECVLSNVVSTDPALNNSTSGGDMLPKDPTCAPKQHLCRRTKGGELCALCSSAVRLPPL